MSVRNAVATRDANKPSVGQFIQTLRPEIQRALPKGMDADRIARLALTVVRRDDKLAACAPESFAGALLTAAALGLEPGINGEAYLVAYRGECTLIVGYQGLAKLFWQHPLANHLDAQAVHENDEFDYAYGLEPYLSHKPATGERGKVVAYYAVASLTTGAKAFIVLTPEEVKALRGGKTGSNGGIPDPMHWMERKTALRQLFKLVPKSATLSRALDADEKTGTELRRELDNAPVDPPSAIQPPTEPEVDENGVIVAEVVDETGGADPENDGSWPDVRQPADA
jgi:recombination protein RecT